MASQALLDGFVAYGWNRDELLNDETDLIDKLKSYLTGKNGPRVDKQASNVQQQQKSLDLVSTAVGSTVGFSPQGMLGLDYIAYSSISASPIDQGSLLDPPPRSDSLPSGRQSKRRRTNPSESPITLDVIDNLFGRLAESRPPPCESDKPREDESNDFSTTLSLAMSEDRDIDIENAAIDTNFFNRKWKLITNQTEHFYVANTPY